MTDRERGGGATATASLRGISTVNLWTDDLLEATLVHHDAGREPYFTSEAAGRGPGYAEFRVGDYEHELGDRRDHSGRARSGGCKRARARVPAQRHRAGEAAVTLLGTRGPSIEGRARGRPPFAHPRRRRGRYGP
jgi:hypothetical protein